MCLSVCMCVCHELLLLLLLLWLLLLLSSQQGSEGPTAAVVEWELWSADQKKRENPGLHKVHPNNPVYDKTS